MVLLSGGLDSGTVLALARSQGRECHTVAFDYGQRHRHELLAAANLSRLMGAATHRVIALDPTPFSRSALTSEMPVPKGRSSDEMSCGIPVTYVPARNLVFLSLAVALAESLECEEVFLGVNAVDYSGYPDCRPEFIRSFETTANLATKSGVEGRAIHVRAPLVALSKAAIVRLGVSLGLDYSLTHSCYDPVTDGLAVLACGDCDSCRLRRAGFADAGVPDPTRYACLESGMAVR